MELDKATKAKLRVLIAKKIKDLQESHITIRTAFELNKSQKNDFEKAFGIKDQADDITYTVDESILGGFIVERGSVVVDGSFKSKLHNLLR